MSFLFIYVALLRFFEGQQPSGVEFTCIVWSMAINFVLECRAVSSNAGTVVASRCVGTVSVWTAASVIHSTLIHVCNHRCAEIRDFFYVFLLGEENEASPSIANTLWRVWTMFTRSAIIPPEVNGFGWDLGNFEYIVWSCPWQILVAISAEAAAGAGARAGIFVFFCPLNNARFYRLPVGQISRNLHKKTCFRVLLCRFGKHLWIFGRKGSFFPKPPFLLDQSQRFPTSGRDFSETITNLGKSWQVGPLVECWRSTDTVEMNSKWFPWPVARAHREQFFPQKYSSTTSTGDDFTACCITLNAVSRRGLMTSQFKVDWR